MQNHTRTDRQTLHTRAIGAFILVSQLALREKEGGGGGKETASWMESVLAKFDCSNGKLGIS